MYTATYANSCSLKILLVISPLRQLIVYLHIFLCVIQHIQNILITIIGVISGTLR